MRSNPYALALQQPTIAIRYASSCHPLFHWLDVTSRRNWPDSENEIAQRVDVYVGRDDEDVV